MARWQAGVFTRDQAMSGGWTARQVKRRVVEKVWIPVLGDGLVEAGPPIGHAQQCWAAHLTWPDRVISHRSAAFLLGWPVGEPSLVDILSPAQLYRAKGLRLHCAPLLPGEVGRLDGRILITGEPRTTLDCFGTLRMPEALDLYAWLMSRQKIDREALVAAVHDRNGRPGNARLRELLRVTRTGAVSGGEYTLHALLRRAGITGWEANVRLSAYGLTAIADVYFALERVVIEFDGRRAHSSRDAFVRDRRRQNTLQRAGILVLRYTWDDLVDRPDHVIAEIRAVLAQRRP